MRRLLLASLLIPLPVLLLQGCVAATAGVGAGVMISQEGLDNSTYVAQVPYDVKHAWPTVKATLSTASLKPIETQDEMRTAIGDVDGAKVTVVVEAYDIDKTILKVWARKYGVSNGEIAKIVLDKILADLEQ